MISYVIPTRDRPRGLRDTLLAIEALGDHASCGGAEVMIADNDSSERLVLPLALAGRVPVREVRLGSNAGAAARNLAAREAHPASQWIIMLDDDSYPLDLGFVPGLMARPEDVAAVSADVFLPPTADRPVRREAGGLPEVFIGCGVAIRREVFLRLGGYDERFGYYAEEYDLAARMLLDGHRVEFDPAFRVMHAKDSTNRDMNLILSRLVRNNGWVMQRYAPREHRPAALREVRNRYRQIARKERASPGYATGLAELRGTLRDQSRTPMPPDLWDRFTGLAAARRALLTEFARCPFGSAAIVDPGKNAGLVERALVEMGVRVTAYGEEADVRVIGTLSPGPMLDALEARLRHRYPGGPRVLAPWLGPLGAGAPAGPTPQAAPVTKCAA